MNKLEIYISTLLSSSIGFFFNFCMFLLFYFLLEPDSHAIGVCIIFILPLFINLYLLSLGFSLILSNLYVVAKDISQIWTVFVGFLFFLSPIFYKLSVFRKSMPGMDYVNPISGLIINARRAFFDNAPPEMPLFIYDFGIAIFLVLLGLIMLNKLGAKAAEKL
jgi:ABC-type polysaccharide/polyol phosphate export permease